MLMSISLDRYMIKWVNQSGSFQWAGKFHHQLLMANDINPAYVAVPMEEDTIIIHILLSEVVTG